MYVIRCSDGSLYTGITTDVKRRFLEHQGSSRGSKYLRGKAPLQLVLKKKIGERCLALKVEGRVKKLTKIKKEMLVEGRIRITDIRQSVCAYTYKC